MLNKELDEKIVKLAYELAPKINVCVGDVLDRLYAIIDEQRQKEILTPAIVPVQTEIKPIPPDGLELPRNRAERRRKAPSNPKYTHKRKG